MRILLFFSTLLCLFALKCSYADNVAVQLSSDKITLGDTFTLSFAFNNNSGHSSPDFSPLEENFYILSKNYGKAVNMLNGAITTQTFWQLTLEAKKTGTLIIPEINFGNVKSSPRQLTVYKNNININNINNNSNNNNNSGVSIQAEISDSHPYVQSQVIYTFKLFYQSQLENPRIEMPKIKNAVFVQLGGTNQYQTTIKGQPFFVVEKNFAFFPQQSGKIFLPSTNFSALVYDNNASMMYNSFYFTTPKILSLATKAFNLTVKKIPEEFQGTTWLPAKNISLTENWSGSVGSAYPDKWELNNPVTRTITVEAQGLRADQIPDFSIDKIANVNIYADSPKRSNRVENKTIIGILQQKVTYIPNSLQSFTIPSLKLNWWNLKTDRNELAQLNSISVSVKEKINHLASTHTNTPASVATTTTATSKINLNPISMHMPHTNKGNLFYQSIWFWIAVLLLIVWLVTLFLFLIMFALRRSRNDRLEGRLNKNKKSNQNSYAHFSSASTHLTEKQFALACHQGNAVFAQQFLLSWAKKQLPDTPLCLEKLHEMVKDQDFKSALNELEHAIYAKKITPWHGHALWIAYKKIKKQWKKHPEMPIKTQNQNDIQIDPLPPLNP